MDDCRFDNFTRAIARTSSRRQILKGLIGGLAGGLAVLRAADGEAEAARGNPAGTPCARGAECASRFCVDGVCCASPCTGQCESCATGTCLPVSGAPVGNRPACPGSDECAATCNGQNRNACAFPGADVACGEPTCANGVQTSFACAGNGTCHPTTTICGLFLCNNEGTACLTTCASDEECIGEAFCGGGVCVGDGELGAPCAGDDSCQSGVCADGVCCAEACGECNACDLPGSAGTCVPNANGTACDGGACCGGACCDGDRVCVDGNCQAPTCLPAASRCSTIDDCCQDELTRCEDVPRCGDVDENRCCHPVGGSCIGFDCECCGSARCQDGTCVEACNNAGVECFVDDHCCDDLVCRDNTCQEASSICLAPTELCDSADQCCQDVPTLCEDVPQSGIPGPQCCRPRGGACSQQFLDCCGTDECIGGVCVANCHPFGLECFVDEHCCSGHCLNGLCRDEACLAAGSFCSAAEECCQDEPSFCEDIPRCGNVGEDRCCRPVGGTCTGSSCECCGAATCQDGICVDACIDFGLECFLDDHCCSGECDAGVCAQN